MQRKELVAYHEAGHAVVGALIPDYDQVPAPARGERCCGTGRGGAGQDGLTGVADPGRRLEQSGDEGMEGGVLVAKIKTWRGVGVRGEGAGVGFF